MDLELKHYIQRKNCGDFFTVGVYDSVSGLSYKSYVHVSFLDQVEEMKELNLENTRRLKRLIITSTNPLNYC